MSYKSPDGRSRKPAEERRINEAMALTFQTEAGQFVLEYLKSITIRAVGGPNITDAHLRHLEGQRFITALIEQRILDGNEKLPEDTPDARTRTGRSSRSKQ